MSSPGECLAIRIDRKLNSTAVIEVVENVFVLQGKQEHVRSDDRLEFIATAVWTWIVAVGARAAIVELSSRWEDGHWRASIPSSVTISSMAASASPANHVGAMARTDRSAFRYWNHDVTRVANVTRRTDDSRSRENQTVRRTSYGPRKACS